MMSHENWYAADEIYRVLQSTSRPLTRQQIIHATGLRMSDGAFSVALWLLRRRGVVLHCYKGRPFSTWRLALARPNLITPDPAGYGLL